MEDTETVRMKASPETLRMLYPLFKAEVFRRRESMLNIVRSGSIALFFFLAMVFLLPHPGLADSGKLLLAGGVGLFTAALLFQLRAQSQRHAEAKRQLIDLERALQLFESIEGNEHVYPHEWERPAPNRLLVLLSACLILLTLLCWAALLLS